MIDFMIIGAPRSGTAWCANWLTTERSFCWHDPLFDIRLEDLDSRIQAPGRLVGIADTGIWMFPEFLERHPARKVIIHRDVVEINRSLGRAGLPPIPHQKLNPLWALRGVHVEFQELFKHPQRIHRAIFGDEVPFDDLRHALLTRLNVQMDFDKLDPDPQVTAAMLRRLAAGTRA